MYSKAGISKVFTTIPIKVKDSEDNVLVNIALSLTVRLRDYTKLTVMDANKIKEKVSKHCSKGFFDAVKFLNTIAKEYEASKVFLNIRFGYTHKGKMYPISFDYEYAKGRLIKSILNVVVQEINESGVPVTNGYITDFRINFIKFIWFEDIIDSIEGVLKDCKDKPYKDVVKSIINDTVSTVTLSTDWYNMLIMQGNNVVVSERKLRR